MGSSSPSRKQWAAVSAQFRLGIQGGTVGSAQFRLGIQGGTVGSIQHPVQARKTGWYSR